MTSDRFPYMTSSVIIRSAVETRAAYINCNTIKSNYCSQRPLATDKAEYRYPRERWFFACKEIYERTNCFSFVIDFPLIL